MSDKQIVTCLSANANTGPCVCGQHAEIRTRAWECEHERIWSHTRSCPVTVTCPHGCEMQEVDQ